MSIWSRAHGYALTKRNSCQNRSIYLVCDRQGESKAKPGSTRSSASRKCGCEFKLAGTTRADNRNLWKLEFKNGNHNHGPSSNPAGHAVNRRLTEPQLATVKSLSQHHIQPFQILQQLRKEDKTCVADLKNVYNAKKLLHLKALGPHTPFEHFLYKVQNSDWLSETLSDVEGVVKNLFVAHPRSIKLAKRYHHVCLMDSTYRTNKFDLPLLHIVGQSATNKTFSIAFCFLESENDHSYLWAIRQL